MGRPKGSQNKPVPAKEPRGRKPARVPKFIYPEKFVCRLCGKEDTSPENVFYSLKQSPLYERNAGYAFWCIGCVGTEIDKLREEYDHKTSVIIMCHYLDVYFDELVYESLASSGDFSFGVFLRRCNVSKKNKGNFNNYLTDLLKQTPTAVTPEDIRAEHEKRWSIDDIKNKSYCIRMIGYDCFEDSNYLQEDLKFLYNALSDYLTDDVLEDSHKKQSVIMMTKTLQQLDKVNKLITEEFRKPTPDEGKLKILAEVKSRCSDSINKAADENGISAKSSGRHKAGGNSLTRIMKEMEENNFEPAKVNVIDAKMSASYKEIAEVSARAIFSELNFTQDDYARMVAEQAKVIHQLQSDKDDLEEDLRIVRRSKAGT